MLCFANAGSMEEEAKIKKDWPQMNADKRR
jgi:hypothetical protein